MTIRVLLADDQPLVRQALRLMIDSEPGLEVVAEASSGMSAVTACRAETVDVVLMDNHMPGLSGVEASRQITSDPHLAGVRILMHTAFLTGDLVATGLSAGVSGFLQKGVDPDTLIQSIREVAGAKTHAG
ncbi:response regulator transcription factor [Actinoplanes sp. LDG1-06]|uniref:Response regulator transcription factor n=1 Tax=Paractinoplanes ovalisporus TaxID=2810368 RepID=A0ABS2A4P7_9ACTN|nr:response regulator transcription factor [Actinoplanes ovalisporus]MBM2614819.1 response regulator transcription factor [Actinoplanes ovalisporus]